jgi:hypothetical protein
VYHRSRNLNGYTYHSSTFQWPFPLVVRSISDSELFIYRPQSDYLVTRSELPRLIVKINSDTADVGMPLDCAQMLLQGAYVVRMANTLAEFKEKKDFALVALYFSANGHVKRYLLYQKDDEVCYKLICCFR